MRVVTGQGQGLDLVDENGPKRRRPRQGDDYRARSAEVAAQIGGFNQQFSSLSGLLAGKLGLV
jgi:hypothetical protein